MKHFFIIALALSLAIAPCSAMTEAEREGIETSVGGISLSIISGTVHVSGAMGEDLEIFNLTGAKVCTVHIDSNDKSFSLNVPKGCYLVKVGKIIRKISVR